MYAETIFSKPSCYNGCSHELADGYHQTIKYMDDKHQQSIEIFAQIKNEQLDERCLTPGGTSIPIWKWLRAMVEHEIHHRGQLYTYLGIIGVETPPIFGLTSEEVIENSKRSTK